MIRRNKKVSDWFLLIAQFGLSFLFFGMVLNAGSEEILVGGDVVWLFHPLLRFAFGVMEVGNIPLWNPQLFLGFPHYAEPQLSTFYPPMWIAAHMPIGTAFSVLYAFHFGLAGAGGYCLARQLRVSRGGASVSGFLMAYSAFTLSHLHAGHFPHLMTIAYAPWLVCAAYWAIEKRTFAAAIIASLPLGLAMLVGYAPFLPFLVIIVSVVMLFAAWQAETRQDTLRIIAQWMVLGGMSGVLAAIQLLPTMEYATLTSRVASADYTFANSLALPFWGLLTLIAPDIFGAPFTNAIYWADAPVNAYWEFAVYVGILPLLLYGIAWVFNKSAMRLWLWIGVAGVAVAFGAEFALHRLLYQLVPGFGLFRVPGRYGWFTAFAVAIVCGMMLDAWQSAEDRQPILTQLRRYTGWLLPLLFAFTLFGVLLQAVTDDPIARAQLAGVVSQLLRALIFIVIAMLFLHWKPRSRPLFYATAILILMADLWGYGGKFLELDSADPPLGWQMTDLVLPPERNSYRIATRGLPENTGVGLDFFHVSGYDDFRPEGSAELDARVHGDARIARLLGTRYLIHGSDYDKEPIAPNWNELTRPAGAAIYERTDAQSRAFVVHQVRVVDSADAALDFIDDPNSDFTQEAVVLTDEAWSCEMGEPTAASSTTITAYGNEYVAMTVETDAPGLLVLSDLFYPGWEATINGQPATIWRTDYALRGVCVDAGQYQVTFQFKPTILRYGAVVTAVGVMILLGALVLNFWFQKR